MSQKCTMQYMEADQSRSAELPEGSFKIGRNKVCDVAIADLSISKQHCECTVVGGVLMVRDLGSRNGTWINGNRVGDEFEPVTATDQLLIGKLPITLTFASDDDTQQ